MHVLLEGDQASVTAQGVNLRRVFHRQDYERARLIGGNLRPKALPAAERQLEPVEQEHISVGIHAASVDVALELGKHGENQRRFPTMLNE